MFILDLAINFSMAENQPKGIWQVEGGWIFLLDKAEGWTSFDLVKKIRNTLKIKKVGHAGTLDPLATGVVMVCAGKATKLIDGLMAGEKEYTGTIVLGATTPTYDLESAPDIFFPIDHITESQVMALARQMVGPQEQIPPIFSALKVDGKKMYELARIGKEVEVKPRPIEIYEFEITRFDLPEIDFRVTVSKGTYIRSLAFDFGRRLQSGAYLKNLRRIRSGDHTVADGLTIEKWLQAWKALDTSS